MGLKKKKRKKFTWLFHFTLKNSYQHTCHSTSINTVTQQVQVHFTQEQIRMAYNHKRQCSASLVMPVLVRLLSHAWRFATPRTAASQLSFTISQSLLRLMSTESVMPSNHPILCHPLLLLPSVFPSVRVFRQLLLSCFSRVQLCATP